ncbi:hypothetical protein [Hymenobacter negativus]|uniref:Lipoprotein n=1 Tax=Hymenobacter negativus TaxID=2795026 RepID=A0ABS3QAJ7_9BACT|nr:hypothetical protein [Hymenobacter negativus]MBO2008221.1 hypothetical protein [Hymenobacter negativus]
MKNISLILLLTTVCACSDPKTDKKSDPVQQAPVAKNEQREDKEKPVVNDSEQAKAWLIKSIEDNFNIEKENKESDKTPSIYTADYEAYKQDGINLEYDDTMTLEGFKKKWGDKYNTEHVGSGGFLISGQDNGHITVTRCELKSTTKENDFVFDVVIHDSFKIDYKEDIRVTHTKDGYKIDDVIEH